MTARLLVFAMVGAVSSLGCYRYVPTTLELVPPGSEVRALLSTEGQVAMLNGVGMDARSILGTLEAHEGETVRFAVVAPFAISRPGAPPELVRFDLSPRDVLRIEVKHLDRQKTTFLAGALLATTGAIAIMIAKGVGTGGSPPGPGGIPPAR